MPRAITIIPKPPKLEQKKRVAAYARVSSGKDAMLHSLSAQVSYYSDLIQNHDDWLYVGVYADEAKTGTKESRADFQRLIADCRAGKIDMVITKSISRFARNTVTLLQTVRDFKAWEVDIFFEEQNIHTMSGDGELMTIWHPMHRKKADPPVGPEMAHQAELRGRDALERGYARIPTEKRSVRDYQRKQTLSAHL